MATNEELKTQASLVIDTLSDLLDDLVPIIRIYPQLPPLLCNDTEQAIDMVQRFCRALATWRDAEPPRDDKIRRMQATLEIIARMGRAADQRLQESDPTDMEQHDIAYYGALRQLGELADRGLGNGNGWLEKEGDDADFCA